MITFVKPADIASIVETLQEKLRSPKRARYFQQHTLATFLREHKGEIVSRALEAMKLHPRLSAMPFSDKQRENHLINVVEQLSDLLDSKPPEATIRNLEAAAEHGETRQRQGYSPILLVDDTRVLGSAIYAVVQENLLSLNLSNLIPDLCRINDSLEAQLQAALEAFMTKDAA